MKLSLSKEQTFPIPLLEFIFLSFCFYLFFSCTIELLTLGDHCSARKESQQQLISLEDLIYTGLHLLHLLLMLLLHFE